MRQVVLTSHAQEGRSCGHESAHLNQQHSRSCGVMNLCCLPGIRAHGLHSHGTIQDDSSSHSLGLLLISMDIKIVTLCNRRAIMGAAYLDCCLHKHRNVWKKSISSGKGMMDTPLCFTYWCLVDISVDGLNNICMLRLYSWFPPFTLQELALGRAAVHRHQCQLYHHPYLRCLSHRLLRLYYIYCCPLYCFIRHWCFN